MAILIQALHEKKIKQQLIRNAAKETLLYEGIDPDKVELSIVLTDDSDLQRLNKEYRGLDKPTDVLSFFQEDDFMPVSSAKKILGDIVISLDTAEFAVDETRTLSDEVCWLVIHGVLHLLGYDDETEKGYNEMVKKGLDIFGRL